MKRILYLYLFCAHSLAFSQEERPKKFISQQIGTLGFGLEYNHGFTNRFSLRGNINYFQLNQKITYSNTVLFEKYRLFRIAGIGVIADWRFLENVPNWKVSAGLYLVSRKASETRDYIYVNEDFTEDLGRLSIEFSAFPVNPYVGFLYGNFKSTKPITYSIEFGTLFHGQPKVEFTGTGRIEQTTQQVDIIRDNVKNYMFYPVLNFKLNYKLK